MRTWAGRNKVLVEQATRMHLIIESVDGWLFQRQTASPTWHTPVRNSSIFSLARLSRRTT